MSKSLIRTAAFAVVLASGTVPALAQAATGSVVVVNIDRVYQESAAGKYATAQLRPQVDQFDTRRRTLAEQLQREQQTLEAGARAKTITDVVLQQRGRDLQQRAATAQTELQGKQRTIQATQQSVIQQINDAMNPIVTAIMKEKGAVVAIPSGATLQVSTTVDITPLVISRLDQSLPRVNMTAPAAPASAPAR